MLLLFNNMLRAQNSTTPAYHASVADTTGKYLIASDEIKKPASAIKSFELPDNLQATLSKPQERKKLMSYLRQLNVNGDQSANTSHKKFFYHLANTFASLKMYPLAMKCFFKALEPSRKERKKVDALLASADTTVNYTDSLFTDTADFDAGYLGFNSEDDTLMDNHQAMMVPAGQQLEKSPPITYQRILQTFNDGKKAVAYAMLIHVKQPTPGKRKVYVFTNSGHTYITLIKYNSDSTYVSLSYGFYPKKSHLLSGTPVWPSSPSVFRNDANYKWDEVAGKFISKKKFEKILALTQKYDGVKYHLSTNNCTDFSLKAASMANITIKGTEGSWPLGHGNNPGVTGQSMLQGKVYNANTSNQANLFIDHDDSIKVIDK